MQEDETTNPTPTPTPKTPSNAGGEDAELKAINAVVAALSPLKEDQRLRALEYVLRRFNAVALQAAPVTAAPTAFSQQPTNAVPFTPGATTVIDIRSLREQKSPRSANEMAALVAYYLSELAPPNDRKNEITPTDIERYFKMAGFALPADARFTLVNAKNSGYIDSLGGGQYKLNPVGYNLVVHRMGKNVEGPAEPHRRSAGAKRRNKTSKKTPRAKK